MTAGAQDLTIAGQLIDAAFLVSTDGEQFNEISKPPRWYAGVFGDSGRPGDESPFLADFLERVGESGEGRTKSGLWEEKAHYFEAVATRSGERIYLMIESADERHGFQQQILHSNHIHELNRQRLRKEQELKKILLECVMHDLANPAAVLLMNLQHIERSLADGERDHLLPAVERAIGQVNRQKQLIQSIGDVFRADSGIALEVGEDEAPGLLEIVGESAGELEAPAGKRGVSLQIDGDAAVRVRGDRLYLRRIFENLLSNAVRYSPRGGTIRVSSERHGNFVRTEVTDEGSGFSIDPGKVFDAFQQGEENPGSSGLGLYFCRMAVEMFGGNISAENRDGGGARVIVNLPAAT